VAAQALTGCTAPAGDALLDDFPPPRADFERHVAAVRRLFAQRFTSSRARLVVYGEADGPAGPREFVRPGRYPRHRILNQSHQSLMISPDNLQPGLRLRDAPARCGVRRGAGRAVKFVRHGHRHRAPLPLRQVPVDGPSVEGAGAA